VCAGRCSYTDAVLCGINIAPHVVLSAEGSARICPALVNGRNWVCVPGHHHIMVEQRAKPIALVEKQK
jgi:hypothetical protein